MQISPCMYKMLNLQKHEKVVLINHKHLSVAQRILKCHSEANQHSHSLFPSLRIHFANYRENR